jgi:DNA-binding SARP family transcriptional activator
MGLYAYFRHREDDPGWYKEIAHMESRDITIDPLTHCRTSLQEVREKIRDIKAKLLPEDEERTLKRQLRRLKAVEEHLTVEIRRLEQLDLFAGAVADTPHR